jgi:hypothetical protein
MSGAAAWGADAAVPGAVTGVLPFAQRSTQARAAPSHGKGQRLTGARAHRCALHVYADPPCERAAELGCPDHEASVSRRDIADEIDELPPGDDKVEVDLARKRADRKSRRVASCEALAYATLVVSLHVPQALRRVRGGLAVDYVMAGTAQQQQVIPAVVAARRFRAVSRSSGAFETMWHSWLASVSRSLAVASSIVRTQRRGQRSGPTGSCDHGSRSTWRHVGLSPRWLALSRAAGLTTLRAETALVRRAQSGELADPRRVA